jgi:aerotolerance regulator-like protein
VVETAVSLGLAAPLWLLGLLGLLAPLVLHLLARGRGRRVRVGSVRLLADSPPRRPRRLQLQRPWLLALRCLLLALVALALAGPRLRREAAAAAMPRPWVLVEPGVDASVTGARGAIAAGAEVRLLAAGLPRAAEVADPAALPDLAAVPGGLWSLLREAAAKAPPGTRLLVVTRGRLTALRGERPALANAIEWHEVPDPRPNRWVARALATDGGAALLVGTSDRTRTTFAREPASTIAGAARGPGVGGPRGVDAVPADDRPPQQPRPVRVQVLAAPDRAADARYVHAAIAAAAEAAGIRIEIAPREPAALAFWLADAPPPPALLDAASKGGWLITDGGSAEESCRGTFVVVATAAPVALSRCSGDSPSAAASETPAPRTAAWRTDAGRPLLVEQPIGSGHWLRFASRFHPGWSELVLSPAFPEWLRGLLRSAADGDATSELPASDRRADGGQGKPAISAAARETATPPATAPSSSPPSPLPERVAWLLLFPLLLAERWLAARP